MLAVETHDLEKTYTNGVRALNGVSFNVEEGDFFALLGPNGAGKSTIISILTSLIRKTAGHAKIFGYDIDRHMLQAKACVGVVPQEFNFGMFEKVEHVLINQAGYYGIPYHTAKLRAEKVLKDLSLWEKRHVMTRELSGGMKRRLLIARALMHEPRLLILDEPTAGVDIEIRRTMWDFLQDLNASGTTIILTTHYLEEAEKLCRRVAIIQQGHIVSNDSMRHLLSKLVVEYFILDLREPLVTLPVLSDYHFTQIDSLTLEVAVPKDRGLNDLFVALTQQGIVIHSLRNKSNRLEALLLSI